ncbi:4-alpha-glucanotransferase DPE2, partial [Olea europaea subsp. europaea]
DVDYEATIDTKLLVPKNRYSQEKEATLSSTSFHNFLPENQDWLRLYAAFCILCDLFENQIAASSRKI